MNSGDGEGTYRALVKKARVLPEETSVDKSSHLL